MKSSAHKSTAIASRRRLAQRRGVSMFLIIFMLIAMLAIACYAIDMANLQREHAENQVVSDLASRFGANMTTKTSDTKRIQAFIDAIVGENLKQRNMYSSAQTYQTEYGTVDPVTLEFVMNGTPLNSVRMRTDSKLRSIGLPNSRLQLVDVSRDATAVSFHQDVCVVIDRSSSMCFNDFAQNYPTTLVGNAMVNSPDPNARARADEWWQNWAHPEVTRWARLIDALDAMAVAMEQTPQDELLSIVSYSHDHSPRFWNHNGELQQFYVKAAELESSPSFQYQNSLDQLKTKYRDQQLVYGFTNITAGINQGTQVLTGNLARANAFKTMIVMTDGQYNQGGFPGPAAEQAARQGIRIITVTFGEGAAQDTMRQVAELAHGVHFHARNGAELADVFRKIASIPPGAYIE